MNSFKIHSYIHTPDMLYCMLVCVYGALQQIRSCPDLFLEDRAVISICI